jgi:LmbE family N-acetylglucosaminyl deacetylase
MINPININSTVRDIFQNFLRLMKLVAKLTIKRYGANSIPYSYKGMINIYNIFVRMKFWGCLTTLFCVFSNVFSFAQAPPTYNSSDVLLRIQKLKVLGSVLYIAAHPDDENTRLLAWLSNAKLVRTGYLSITRGDGGQNLIGDEQGIELGLIRTQELLAARRLDGAEQFFTRAFDFGYSKSTEEALKFWGKDQVLSDVVWVIRKFQPDVIITRFPPDNRAGHGQHSASTVLANEAFRVAADPKAFPEQLMHGVKPWQAKRIFWNSYQFGDVNYTRPDQMKIDVGGFNPLIGPGYGEIAAESRSQHKSQGFGVSAGRGSWPEFFSFTDGSKTVKTLTEGINFGWSRIGAAKIGTLIDAIIKNFQVDQPAKSVPALTALYKDISKLPDGYWRTRKLKELQEVIAAASGLWMEAYGSNAFAKQGDSLKLNIVFNNQEGAPVKLNKISVENHDTIFNVNTERNKNYIYSPSFVVTTDHAVSQPYWLKNKMQKGYYVINDQELIGKPESDPAFIANFDITINGQSFTFKRPVQQKYTDPVKGELYEPLVVVPHNGNASQYGTLRHISYDHIPDIYYFNNDTVKIVLKDVKTDGKKIGYIEGAGDKVMPALTLMGYDVTVIREKDINANYLRQFDAIVTGVRAYNVHRYLTEKNAELNEYVKNGGNLVVQYNTNSFVGPNTATIGPVPFNISRNRITDETAPVKFLIPDHQVFNYPNKISASDFDNWVQERGIYFAEKLDKSFVTPLAMHDPGEDDQNGSLIIADYGKGKFVYTGLVFFRQLPAGVTGAYRLLANIIALNKQPK